MAACVEAPKDLNQYQQVQPAKIGSRKAKIVMTDLDGVEGGPLHFFSHSIDTTHRECRLA